MPRADRAELGRHLAAAVAQHVRRLRGDGVGPPAGVVELAAEAARDGLERPGPDNVDDTAPAEHGVPVAPLLVDYRTAGDVLSVSERTVRRLVAARRLPAVRVDGGSRSVRVRVADLAAYVAALDPLDPNDDDQAG